MPRKWSTRNELQMIQGAGIPTELKQEVAAGNQAPFVENDGCNYTIQENADGA